MHTIQIGTVVLNGPLLLYVLFGAVGWLIMKYRLREAAERDLILSCAANAFWLWLIVWKGSYMLAHPVEFIQQPMALLYFDGGTRGMWTASLVSAAYIGYRSWRRSLSIQMWLDLGVWLLFGCWFVYHSLLLAISGEAVLFHAASAALAAGCFILLVASQSRTDSGKYVGYAVWFSVGNALLPFLVSDRPLRWLSFSTQQLVFMLAAVCLTGWSAYAERRKKEGTHG
ncbi:hypothetical protein ACFFNY_30710 [Paenibacillus hodogayensis]|uniref:Uncharacterized protein n=1 Tax=Paenibacillus hodogayensis TaxID=279208 RepID=A0ABV5W5X4_9BACL